MTNVRAISGFDEGKVAETISKASIMAVAVGKNALKMVIPSIAKGLKLRFDKTPDQALDIIIAENMRNGVTA